MSKTNSGVTIGLTLTPQEASAVLSALMDTEYAIKGNTYDSPFANPNIGYEELLYVIDRVASKLEDAAP